MGKLTEQDHKKGDNWQSPLWVSLQNKTIERESTNNHHYGQTYRTRPQKGRQLTITTMGKLTAQAHKKGNNWQAHTCIQITTNICKHKGREMTVTIMCRLTGTLFTNIINNPSRCVILINISAILAAMVTWWLWTLMCNVKVIW